MDPNPYLVFKGDCAEAFRFYEKVLGGRIVFMQTHGESPMKDQVAPDWRDKVIHAAMQLGDRLLMGSDAPPNHYCAPQGIHVSITPPADQAERIFTELAREGTVTMPFGETFWSRGFGMAVDRFGIPWMVSAPAAA